MGRKPLNAIGLSLCRAGQRLNPGRVTRALQKREKPLARDTCRRGIHQRMKIERLMHHQGCVEHDCYAMTLVVDRGKRRDRAWRNSKEFMQQRRGAEGEPPRSAQETMQRA